MKNVQLKDINEYKSQSINPSKTPDTVYEVYSVPSHADNKPEYLQGNEIGSNKAVVTEGDVLLCKINPRINRVWVVGKPSEYMSVASSEWIVVRNKAHNPEYLAWYFRSDKFKTLMNSGLTGIGGSLTRAQPKQVATYPVPIRDRNEQDEIVSVLNKVDRIINCRREQLEELDTLIKSRFVEMFGDPVSNPYNLPEHLLSEIGTIGRGVSKHRPRNAPELLGGDYPLIQTGDVANAELYINEYKTTYSEIGLKQSKMWNKGTLCITIAANIAKTSILNFDACFPDSVVGFESNERTNNIFMHYWFAFFQRLLESQAPESAQKNINLKILGELKVIVPSIEKQKQFAEFVELVDELKSAVHKALNETQILFDSLMQDYF